MLDRYERQSGLLAAHSGMPCPHCRLNCDGRGAFFVDHRTQDALIRDLEVIGEAVKHLTDSVLNTQPGIPRKRIAGMRGVLIHHYVGFKLETVWDVVDRELPQLRSANSLMLAAVEEQD